jgi:hypothetical protein
MRTECAPALIGELGRRLEPVGYLPDEQVLELVN